MKKKIYTYYLIVDQHGVYLKDTIALNWANYGVVEKETDKTYKLGIGEIRDGKTKVRLYPEYFQEEWKKGYPYECVVNKSDIDKFKVEMKSGARVIFKLIYRSFKEYSDEEIINKGKKYLKKLFKNIIDNIVD